MSSSTSQMMNGVTTSSSTVSSTSAHANGISSSSLDPSSVLSAPTNSTTNATLPSISAAPSSLAHYLSLSHPLPMDAKDIIKVLTSMGIQPDQVETSVVVQALEFVHRYMRDILEDAEDYRVHRGTALLEADDIELAVQARFNDTFKENPPRELLFGLAEARNKVPLPTIQPSLNDDVLLPHERYCLKAQNYQVDTAPVDSQPNPNMDDRTEEDQDE